jgi:hypothetical protein
VGAAFLFAGTLERGEAAGACAFVLVERAGDGKLAGLAAIVAIRAACAAAIGLLGN